MFSSPIPGRVAPKGREPSLPGDKYNRLTLVSEAPGEAVRQSQQSQRYWNCVCDCGQTSTAPLAHLKSGNTKSCGCWKREVASKYASEHHRTHGMRKTRTYKVWRGVLDRTTNPNNKNYADYMGRGITVAPEWLKFETFYLDMGEAPKGLSIDRIDNNLGYSRENCRWTDAKTQTRNRRSNRLVNYKNANISLVEGCELANLPYDRVSKRLQLGWPISRALESQEFGEPC